MGPRPSWWKRRIAGPLRRRLSLFAVCGGDVRDGQASVTMRVRWWVWPFLLLRGCGELTVQPRAAWAVVLPALLFIGLRQSLRALVGRA